jgi:sialic acid synthase SpsE
LTIGSPDFQPLTESALRYREITRKRVVALKDIESGAVLTRENTGLMRSDSGEPGELLDHLLGRKTKVRLAMFDGIMKENLE